MTKRPMLENIGNFAMLIGVACMAVPFILLLAGPVMDMLIRMDIAWYMFYPIMGALLFILGLVIRVVSLFRDTNKRRKSRKARLSKVNHGKGIPTSEWTKTELEEWKKARQEDGLTY